MFLYLENSTKSQGTITVSKEAVSLADYSVELKTATYAGTSRQAYCHVEFLLAGFPQLRPFMAH